LATSGFIITPEPGVCETGSSPVRRAGELAARYLAMERLLNPAKQDQEAAA